MCGSGTMVVEAALMAMNVAPGLVRYKNGGYAFQNWPDFNEDVFLDCMITPKKKKNEEEEFHQLSEQKNKAACLGNDIHPGSVSLAGNLNSRRRCTARRESVSIFRERVGGSAVY